ncbi:ATP/GTP-binding protein [Blastococcus goldschmidtiae]|uniref:ATP/GTP-binding protein n=1 Tax=Blastococcus goldschmidtiae TaxID=3075546 RepID=A0ABU2K5N3_9ACTN|nr:ATP/GTP-binding protein [Blastococcus sp. DSM 46792]MDT0275505.1 ATP/GTP-binding protein [Blastococcus sp. DSM 46792]
MLRTFGVVLLAAAMLAAPGGLGSAMAAPVACAKQDAQTGICLVEATSPGQPADADLVVDGASSGGVPETGGDASPQNPCTYTVAEPQPAPTSMFWGGRSPDDGAMYVQVCPRVDGSGLTTMLVFVANGTAPPAPPVDPRVLAEQAIASLVMRAPEIRMAPPPGSTSGLVGLPVWMWTERGEAFLGPTRQSVSAGGVTVAAVGRVGRIVWDMGDGTTVVCGAGTPYSPGAEGPSPDCGHVYAEASSRHVPGGGPWPVTATSTWTVTWSGGGLSGSETLELSSSSELFVGELHVLNQDGSSR